MEIIFSALMVTMPLVAIFYKNISPFFLLTVIGSNPYVSAISLFVSLIFKSVDIIRGKINLSILILTITWLGYGLLSGIINPSIGFVSEYFQLVLSCMLLLYIYQVIDSEYQLYVTIKYIVYSGVLLAFIEIAIFIFGLGLDTLSFISTKSDNYTSFYLLIATVNLPLLFLRKNWVYALVVPLGLLAIYINQSRAMIVLAMLLILREVFHHASIYTRLVTSLLFMLIAYYMYINIYDSLVHDPNSLFSIFDFDNNFSNLERLKLLIHSYNIFLEQPYGHGLGSSYELFTSNPLTVKDIYPHPHNALAFLSVELGIVGVFLYIYFFLSLFKSSSVIQDKQIRRMCGNSSLALLFFSFVDAVFYNGVLMLIVFMLVGIILSASKIVFNAEKYI
jgi:O-antigen ligase